MIDAIDNRHSPIGNPREPLNCPFCGWPPLVTQYGTFLTVACRNGRCHIQPMVGRRTGRCPRNAVEVWNDRTAIPAALFGDLLLDPFGGHVPDLFPVEGADSLVDWYVSTDGRGDTVRCHAGPYATRADALAAWNTRGQVGIDLASGEAVQRTLTVRVEEKPF